MHRLTQKRWRGVRPADAIKHWLRHLLLVDRLRHDVPAGRGLPAWFQIEDAAFHWTSLFGYYATAGPAGRHALDHPRPPEEEGADPQAQRSGRLAVRRPAVPHGLSGILLHLCRLLDLPMPTYVMYVVHLMIAVSMLVVEVPFGKWSHLLYRPLAIYLQPRRRSPHPGVRR